MTDDDAPPGESDAEWDASCASLDSLEGVAAARDEQFRYMEEICDDDPDIWHPILLRALAALDRREQALRTGGPT
jgi:hypothetical protein